MPYKIAAPLQSDRYIRLIIDPKARLEILEKVRGVWRDRKPDPIKELKRMRREWERKTPLNKNSSVHA